VVSNRDQPYYVLLPENELWWCNAHQRRAIFRREYHAQTLIVCDPRLGGIMLPCMAVNLTGMVELMEDDMTPDLCIMCRQLPNGLKCTLHGGRMTATEVQLSPRYVIVDGCWRERTDYDIQGKDWLTPGGRIALTERLNMRPITQVEADQIDQIFFEYRRARDKFRAMVGPHEGYAVILEELDEMWDAIKKNDIPHARKECLQVAAMCLAFLLEVGVS
jgi:hypothetical protein